MEIVLRALSGMGVDGAIISVLLLTITGLLGVIKVQWNNDRKVYGYRLQERDTLRDALNSAAKVLEEHVKAARERNELTEEQADLIEKQVHSFELLKVTVVSHYDNIKEHNSTASQAVTSMSDAIRTLISMVQENRHHYQFTISELKNYYDTAGEDLRVAILNDIRQQLGNDLLIVKRKRTIHQTRPTKG
jgi:hypothetical protein